MGEDQERLHGGGGVQQAQTGRRHSNRVERHGGGEAWDMPVTLLESQRASEISLKKLWGVTKWMFLFFHDPHSPGQIQDLRKNS